MKIRYLTKRYNSYSLSFLITILFAAVLTTPAATIFYVSTDGSDGNAGTQTAPFATIQKAVDAAEGGDTVKVLAGTYTPQNVAPYRGMIIFRRSGTPDNPITFEAVGDVRVKGDGGVASFSGIFEINGERANVQQIHDIIIRGFHLENSTWFGIHLHHAKNIVVENNYTYNTGGSGILALQSQNIIVRGNTLERACISPDTTMDTQEIVSLSDVDGFEIDHNHIFNGGIVNGGNGGEGIDAKTGARNGTIHHNLVHDLIRLGIYIDSWDRVVENVSLYSNTVYNCAEGIAISSENGGTARRLKLFNNVLYNNRENGIIISDWVANGVREDIEIVNNTIFNNGVHISGQYDWGGGIAIETANARNIVIRNNILSENKLWQISINDKAVKVTIDHNLIDTFRGYVGNGQREQRGKIYIQGNPQFVDSSNGNFQLEPASPAIDRGKSLLVPNKDFNLSIRPQGDGFDLGAFEMSSINNRSANIRKRF